MVARSSFIRVLDDVPTYKELYARVRKLSTRHVILKVDRTETAAEALPTLQRAVHSFNEDAETVTAHGADRDDVLAITMLNVGIVVRQPDGKRATNRNVDILWFSDVPGTTFFANEDVVAYLGEWPDVLCREP